MIRRTLAPVLGATLALGALAGCTDNNAAAQGSSGALTVKATDTECAVNAAEAPSGVISFSVTNSSSKVNEFYLLAEDGLRIIGEVENIGPGLTRDLVLTAQPGTYFTACKPGMVGDGIRNQFTVTDSGITPSVDADTQALVDTANTQYQSYVKDQVASLVTKTEAFAALYKAGKDDEARAAYAPTRLHWERIEPVAESFGDLDPILDAREADLEPGETWTGWHRIEKDLWPARATNYTAMTTAERAAMADKLVADTKTLAERTQKLTFTVDQIANGAKTLLDEVASGKVTGEEEYWSRTDLVDFQGNLDGAKVAWEGLRPILKLRNPELDTELATQFAAVQKLLDAHKSGDGFVGYDKLTAAQVKALASGVNALSEPLSRLTAAVI
ncbi:iron uptake system protein EfeO [Luteococcus sanguinis]|uniref:Iron uptake system protein EfeO n=1 Tax=Luteococcus sanguinis TaxID=174038 RepID=A0ABW1WZI0_9ACTN